MSFGKRFGLAILSGALLGASWFSPFTFLIFIAWVPLLILTEELFQNSKRPKRSIFLFSYLAFLIWNIMDTWWTWFASPGGAVFAIMANALLMSFALWIFLLIYSALQRTTNRLLPASYFLLIPVWLSFEYLHSLWELSWTWITLGNIFAYQSNWVQWYEFTGVSGGSLWVLLVNILIFQLFRPKVSTLKIKVFKITAALFVPLIISFIVLRSTNNISENLKDQEIVIVQPNIDPYNDKFNSSYESQLQQVYEQVKNKITSKTNYLVLPETFFTEMVWENDVEKSYSVTFLRDSILKKFPDLIIITGASTYYRFGPGEKHSPTVHKYIDAEIFYDSFNTGLQLDNFGLPQIYHKSKLVPGVERMPYPAFFKPLEKLTIDLGGTSGSLGTQEERAVFFNKDKTVGVAPVICYESVYGEYLTDYIKKGANLIFIITNDGWWRDSPGYVQHLNYGRLRAIETRVPIARCANTGISCFIDEKGEISQATKWWEPAVIQGSLKPNNNKTFFVKFGDIVSKIALVSLLLALIISLFSRLKKR